LYKPLISSVLCVAIASYGPLGCANSKYAALFRSPQSPTGPDSDTAEQQKLQRELASGRLSNDDEYLTQLKLADLKTKQNRWQRPDPADYQLAIAIEPDRNEAKLSYVHHLIAYADRNGGATCFDPPDGQFARPLIEQVMQTSRPTSELYYLQVRCLELADPLHRNSQFPRKLRDDLENAIELDPGNIDAQVEMARLTLFCTSGRDTVEQRSVKAEALLQHVVSIAPTNAKAHYLLGTIAQVRGKLPAADAEYTRALNIDPDDVDSLAAYAMNDYVTNQLADFHAKVARIAQRHPAHTIVYFQRAVDALGRGDRATAAQNFKIASDYDPYNNVYAGMLEKVNQEQEAVNDKEEAWLIGLLALTVVASTNHNAASGGNDYNPLDFHGIYDAQGYRINDFGQRLDPYPVAPGSPFAPP
jgi:tetratricopeptide (TPR) repeat protein